MSGWWEKVKERVASNVVSQTLNNASKWVMPLLVDSGQRIASSVVGQALKNASKQVIPLLTDSSQRLASSFIGQAVTNTSQRVFAIPLVATSIEWVASSFVGNILKNTWKQVVAIPLVLEAVNTSSKTQQFFLQVARVAGEDYVLVAAVNRINHLIQGYGQAYSLEDENTLLDVSGVFFLQSTLCLLDVLVQVYNVRSLLEGAVRGIVLSTQAGSALAVDKARAPIDGAEPLEVLCQGCPDIIKGNFRDLTAFYASELAILIIKRGLAVSNMDYAGIPSGFVQFASICHQARYILTLVSGDVSNKHLTDYLRRNFDLVISVGLMNFLMSTGLIHSLKAYTNLPPELYENIISQFMIFVNISMAAHMNKPGMKQGELTPQYFDLVDKYETFIGAQFDKTIANRKKIIAAVSERWSSKKTSVIPWDMIRGGVVTLADNHYMQEVRRRALQLLLPTMLQSMDDFIKDPLIRPIWTEFSPPTIEGLWYLGEIQKWKSLQLTGYAQKPLAYTLDQVIGTPVFLNLLMLRLIIYAPFIHAVGELRRAFEWRQERQCSPPDSHFYLLQIGRDDTEGSLFTEKGLALEAARKPFLLSDDLMLATSPRLEDDVILRAMAPRASVLNDDHILGSLDSPKANTDELFLESRASVDLRHPSSQRCQLNDSDILGDACAFDLKQKQPLNDADMLGAGWGRINNQQQYAGVSASDDAFFSSNVKRRRPLPPSSVPIEQNGFK